ATVDATNLDTALRLPAPTTYCYGALTVTFAAPAYEDPAPAVNASDCTAPQPTDCIQVSVVADPDEPIDVAFTVDSVWTIAARPGSMVSVSGSGFGPTGRGWVSGTAAVTTWSDHLVRVRLPSVSGAVPLTLQRLS